MIDLGNFIPVNANKCILNKKHIIRIEYYNLDNIVINVNVVMTDKTLFFKFKSEEEATKLLELLETNYEK